MKNKLILSFFSIALIVLSSCANLCDYDVFYKVSKKTTSTEFLNSYEPKVKETFELTVNNEKYTIYLVNISTLMVSREIAETKRTEIKTHGQGDYVTYETKYHTQNKNHSNPYCFAFKNNHYFYSGFIFEYLRNTESGTKALGEEIYDYIYSVKGEK